MNFLDATNNIKTNSSRENIEKQTDLLLSEMTLKEKIYMLSGHGIGQTTIDMIKTKRNYNVHALPAGGCKRLGIPPIKFTDGPRGVVMGNSTCLPVSMCRAATFDESLEYSTGKLIADEAIAQGANYYAGICINIVRNPRWGRSQETYGEDSFLLGQFGAAMTKSVQEEGMIACPKHFALNSIEDLRFYIDVKTDEKTLREVYLPHFKKCIDAGALSIMGAYNRYDETYCCENKKLLTDILRNEWGFDGFVMSDFVWGVRDTQHSLRAGLDVEMMFTIHYTYKKIKKCLDSGKLNEQHINRAVKNILSVLLRQVPKILPRDISVVSSLTHRNKSREIAEKGIVLLENNGVLPLDGKSKIFVGGSYADVVNVGDHGSSRVWSENVITPFKGLANHFNNATVYSGTDVKLACATCQNADIAILCVGNSSKSEGEYFANTKYNMMKKPENSGGDRATLRLAQAEIELIKELKNKGKKVIVILFGGSAIIVEEWKNYADAIVMNFYSGIEGGTALANLLIGKVNFGAKLPFTVAKTEEHYPPIIGIGEKPYEINYGYYHGYTLFDKRNIKPRYPFGYGLSYTSFQFNDIAIRQDEHSIMVKVSVKNIGQFVGAEVVQVYVGSNNNSIDRPIKLLKGFKRLEIQPDVQQITEITILKEDLCFYDNGNWVLDDTYTIYIGNSIEDSLKRKYNIEIQK